MLLYRCIKGLFWMVTALCGMLFLFGQNALAFMMIPVCLLLYYLQKPLWLRANRQEPLVCVEATLVNHRQQFSGRGVPRYEKSFLTFEVENGMKMEFEVSRDEFDRIRIGAKGPLRYQGSMYVSFRK